MSGEQSDKEAVGLGIPQFKIALVGDHGVGKSALTVKYLTKRFINEYDPTLEEKYSKYEIVNNQKVSVVIMDTYDQESLKNSSRYIDWADGFIIVYSITQRNTFHRAQQLLEIISQRRKHITNVSSVVEPPCVLLGNKTDLERYRQVSKVEGHDLSSQYESIFLESTAAEEYESVSKVFCVTLKAIMVERENKKPLKPLYIMEERSEAQQEELVIKDNYNSSLFPSTSAQLSLPSNTISVLRSPKPSQQPPTQIFKLFNKGFKK